MSWSTRCTLTESIDKEQRHLILFLWQDCVKTRDMQGSMNVRHGSKNGARKRLSIRQKYSEDGGRV